MDTLIYLRATGTELERMMNLCVNRSVFLYDIKKKDDGTRNEVEFSVKPSDYFKMHSILRKTHTRTVILKKSGLPFFVMKMKKAWVFLLSIFICVVVLMFLMQKVWRIEISGNFRITDEAIFGFLKDNNIFYGTNRNKIDYKEVERMLRINFEEISWASVSLEGTTVSIEIRERILPSYKAILNENGKLVAGKDGVVESIIVRSGVPKVKKGDTVTRGQELVGNELYTYNDDLTVKETRYVPCDADIIIRYNENITLNLSKKYTDTIYTGKEKESYYLKLGKFKVDNPFHKTKYEKYKKVTVIKQLCLFDNWYLPVFWGKTCEKEYTTQIKYYSMEEAEYILNKKLEEILLSLQEKGVQIIEKNVNIDLYGNLYTLTGSLVLTDSAYERNDD